MSPFSPISPWQIPQQQQQQQPSNFTFDQAAASPGRAPVIMDQFDEFLYKSKHIGSSNGMLNSMPPEVNVEVPSDSDSSRRPSKYTLSNTSSMYDMQRRRSCVDSYTDQPDENTARMNTRRSHSPSGK